jgi:hypothetical protein
MKVITTTDLRKDASNWNYHFIVKKMKQGRDKIVGKQFVVMDVPPGADTEASIDYAIAYLQQEKKRLQDEK